MLKTKTSKWIVIYALTIILLLLLGTKAIDTWKEIKQQEIAVERQRLLNEVCGGNTGTYSFNTITCR